MSADDHDLDGLQLEENPVAGPDHDFRADMKAIVPVQWHNIQDRF